MPIVKIENNNYTYECDCGTKITLEQDEKPERLRRCFECVGKYNNIVRLDENCKQKRIF